MKKVIGKALSAILIVPFCVLSMVVGAFTLGESYNVLVPDIDTHFTLGYSEKKYFSSQPGVDTSEVIRLIGRPFYVQRVGRSKDLWYYSGDGKCKWMDFAWLGREIFIDSCGKVIRLNTPIHYD